jgi:hypothetical protein
LDLLMATKNNRWKYFLHLEMPFLTLPRPLAGARSDGRGKRKTPKAKKIVVTARSLRSKRRGSL